MTNSGPRRTSGTWLRRLHNPEFLRFLFSGGVNTAVTYVLYLVLLRFMNYTAAYSLTYVAGIAFSYWLNSLFVFRRKMAAGAAIKYALVYILQFVSGVVLLRFLAGTLHVDERLAPLIVVACTVSFTYVLTRSIVSRLPTRV